MPGPPSLHAGLWMMPPPPPPPPPPAATGSNVPALPPPLLPTRSRRLVLCARRGVSRSGCAKGSVPCASLPASCSGSSLQRCWPLRSEHSATCNLLLPQGPAEPEALHRQNHQDRPRPRARRVLGHGRVRRDAHACRLQLHFMSPVQLMRHSCPAPALAAGTTGRRTRVRLRVVCVGRCRQRQQRQQLAAADACGASRAVAQSQRPPVPCPLLCPRRRHPGRAPRIPRRA